MANKTPILHLPQYSETDLFDLTEINTANMNMDTAYGEIKTWIAEVPTVNASVEVVNARQGHPHLLANLENIRESVDNVSIVATAHGIQPLTECGAKINALIDYAIANDFRKIVFPTGYYFIETPIILKNGITIEGMGESTVLKMKNNVNIESVIRYNQNHPTDRPCAIRNLVVDGNRTNNTRYNSTTPNVVNGHGIHLRYGHWCIIENVAIRETPCDGIHLSGTVGSNWNLHCSTNNFINVRTHNTSRHSIYIDASANDNHFSHCDFGASTHTAIKVDGGSNTFDVCAMWGCVEGHGFLINAQQTMIRNCQIEGNGQSGVVLTEYADHTMISGCKFMANSKMTKGGYSDIYASGSVSNNVENATITDCLFLGSSSNADGSGLTTRAIALESTHKSFNISNCKMDYNSDGTVHEINKLQVYGLKEYDVFNGVTYVPMKMNDGDYYLYEQGRLFLDMATGGIFTPNHTKRAFLYIDQTNADILFESTDPYGDWAVGTTMTSPKPLTNYSAFKVLVHFAGFKSIMCDFKYNDKDILSVPNVYDDVSSGKVGFGEIELSQKGENSFSIDRNICVTFDGKGAVGKYDNTDACIKVKKIIGIY